MSVSSQLSAVRARIAKALDDAEWSSVAGDVRDGVDLDTVIGRIGEVMDTEEASEPIAIIESLRVAPARRYSARFVSPSVCCTITMPGGLSISVCFGPECERWEVGIDTKEMDARSGDAEPVLQVTLNAGVLYGHDRPGFEKGEG